MPIIRRAASPSTETDLGSLHIMTVKASATDWYLGQIELYHLTARETWDIANAAVAEDAPRWLTAILGAVPLVEFA
jgi:hypothetical protein